MIWIWLFILFGYGLLTYTLSTKGYLDRLFLCFILISYCPLSILYTDNLYYATGF